MQAQVEKIANKLRLNFIDTIEREKLVRFGPPNFPIQFDLTNACNLRCVHCYHPHHKATEDLDLQQWRDVLDQYRILLEKLNKKPCIAVCGGEPLASPIFFDFLDEMVSRWPDAFYSVLSNGTLVGKHIEKLIRYPLTFQVSLEGPDAATHDLVRGSGNFAKAIAGIQALRSKSIPVDLSVVLSKRSADFIERMFQLAVELNASSLDFARAIPAGIGARFYQNDDSTLSGESMRLALENILRFSREYQMPTSGSKPLVCLIDERLGSRWSAGYQGFVVDHKGNVKLTSRAPFVLGNVRDSNLIEIALRDPTLRALRRGEVETCGDCRYWTRCGGDRSYAYMTTGNPLGPDTGCWLNHQPEKGAH